jgi:hypothetical protein
MLQVLAGRMRGMMKRLADTLGLKFVYPKRIQRGFLHRNCGLSPIVPIVQFAGSSKVFFVAIRICLLLLFSSNIACAEVRECRHFLTGWDSACLTQKTRSILNINSSILPNSELQPYIEQHTDEIVDMLAPLDHGNDVQAFLNGSLYNAQDAISSIISGAYGWVVSTFITAPLM